MQRAGGQAVQPRLAVSTFLAIGRSTPFEGFCATVREELIGVLLERLDGDYAVTRVGSLDSTGIRATNVPRDHLGADLQIEGSLRLDRGPMEVFVRLLRVQPTELLLAKRYQFAMPDSAQTAPGSVPETIGEEPGRDRRTSLDRAIAERIAHEVAEALRAGRPL